MGWFTRTFSNSPEAKVERATFFFNAQRYNDVRLELQGVVSTEASELRSRALVELISLNLQEAKARYNSGDYSGAQEHIQLAQSFGATDTEVREVRSDGLQLQRERQQEVQQKQAKANAFRAVGDDPIWSLPPSDPRLKYAVHLEGYPIELRERLIGLGQEFAMLVLGIDEGNGRTALQTLSHFTEREPAARYERARAALSIGDLEVACSELMLFGDELGHCVINNTHTGALLSQLLLQMGKVEHGLSTVETLVKKDNNPSLQMVYISLLEHSNRLDEAESRASNMLQEHPRALPVVHRLASIKVLLNKRIEAANLIENALEKCCTPGKCSSQPLDINLLRTLARIYLEDRVLPERSTEIMTQMQGLIQRQTWEDLYLSTLRARNEADPFLSEKISLLKAQLKPADHRNQWIETAFS